MVTLSKIYTKTGDAGETGLGDGSRVSKASARIAALGAVETRFKADRSEKE